MTFLEMYTRVRKLSQVNAVTRAKNAVNLIYRQLNNRFFWPQFLIRGTAITLVAGTQTYSLPTDPAFRWMSRMWYESGDNKLAIFLKPSGRVFDSGSTAAGTVEWFRVRKDTGFNWIVGFDRLPNQSFIDQNPKVNFEYFYQPPDLANDDDETRFDDGDDQVIIFGAVVLLTAKQGDAPGFVMFKTLWDDGYADMESKAINFQGAPLVAPGSEITEAPIERVRDYGRLV